MKLEKKGIAWTLINRARDSRNRFPKSIADVCRQKGVLRSWNLKAQALMALPRTSPEYKLARRIVDEALASSPAKDPIEGGQFYYFNGRVAPQWSKDMECGFRSKTHTFCKQRGQLSSVA